MSDGDSRTNMIRKIAASSLRNEYEKKFDEAIKSFIETFMGSNKWGVTIEDADILHTAYRDLDSALMYTIGFLQDDFENALVEYFLKFAREYKFKMKRKTLEDFLSREGWEESGEDCSTFVFRSEDNVQTISIDGEEVRYADSVKVLTIDEALSVFVPESAFASYDDHKRTD